MKKYITVVCASMLFTMTAGADEYPRIQTFLGYTYVRASSDTNVPSYSANGGSGQIIFNFNRWIGAVGDFGAVHNNNLAGFSIDNTAVNFLAGPRVSIRKGRVTPYFQAVFGGVYYTASTPIGGVLGNGPFPLGRTAFALGNGLIPGQPITGRLNASQTDFGMAIGGGLDIRISRHFSFRPIGVDYYMTRLKNMRTLDDTNQNNVRYTAGFVFNFGGEKPGAPQPPAPPAPQTKACPDGSRVPVGAMCPKHDLPVSLSASPSEICPGETAQLSVSMPHVGDAASLHWSVNGEKVSEAPSFVFGTEGREPGTYRVGLTVTGPAFNPATAETTITIREYRAPTGTVQANPAQIYVGEKSTLTGSCSGQCGGPLQAPAYTASEGSVQGDQFDSTGVQFDPANHGEQRKTVSITLSCADSRNTGTATATIDVIQKATAAAVRLPDVLFSDNNARVNNCGKRILLEELRSYVERDPTGTVVLVGHTSGNEKVANLDLNRALNAAAVVTAATGVCMSVPKSQVQVSATGTDQNGVGFESGFCGPSVRAGSSTNAEMRRVEVWFVPTGAQLPPSLTKQQSASDLPVSALGCPK